MTLPSLDLTARPIEELAALQRQVAMQAAPQLPFSADGYRMHYHATSTFQLPSFGWDWIQEFFEKWNSGVRRFGCKAHRGATKSFIWTKGFTTYVLSKFPADGILTVHKNDSAGSKTSTTIADVIENNAGWKTMYPHLVPDKARRWAFEGYDIMDTSLPYEEWRQKVQDRRARDNSFVSYGWANGGIVGMHPNWLFIDDILDEENTRSNRLLRSVLGTLKGNILQTLNRPPEWDNDKAWDAPTCIVSYTPWYADDCYAYLESTGLYYIMETPLIAEAEPSAKGAFEWRQKYWTCAWEVKNPVKLVEDKLVEWGEMDFARMQLLDLKKSQGINLKREWLHEFAYERINNSWPVYMGVDYASTADQVKLKERDYFSISIGRAIPMGGVVLIDGFRDKISSGDAESMVKSYARLYRPVEIGFDKSGKGEDAFNRLRAAGLPMIPCPPKGDGKKSKGERFEGQGGLGSAFQFSQAWISDAPTPFLNAFRDEWAEWPGGTNDDTLDSTYWMLYVAKAFLLVDQSDDEDFGKRREKKKSSFAMIGRQFEERR